LQGTASAGGVTLRFEVDENGSFADEALVRSLELAAAADGTVFLQWYEWPRNGPARDFVSAVTVTWEGEGISVYLEDLFG
jgi:hypothetical protein